MRKMRLSARRHSGVNLRVRMSYRGAVGYTMDLRANQNTSDTFMPVAAEHKMPASSL